MHGWQSQSVWTMHGWQSGCAGLAESDCTAGRVSLQPRRTRDAGVTNHVGVGETLPELHMPCADLSKLEKVDAVILAVGHKEYKTWPLERFRQFFPKGAQPVLVDVMAALDGLQPRDHGFIYWQL